MDMNVSSPAQKGGRRQLWWAGTSTVAPLGVGAAGQAPSLGQTQGEGSAGGQGVRGNGRRTKLWGGGTGAATDPAPIFSHFLRKSSGGAPARPQLRKWSCW